MSQRFLNTKPIIQEQKGQTCKIYALSNAIEWLHSAYPNQSKPYKVRKGKSPENAKEISLRQKAKEVIASKVGEVYGDLNLLKLAKESGYNNFKSVSCSSIAEYCAVINSAVEKNLIPIVLFDVRVSGWNAGQPFNDNGHHEHAAVIYGYYHNPEGELKYLVGQWGKYYEFSAVELAMSNFQLSEERQAEKFIRVSDRWFNAKDIPQEQLSANSNIEQRQANKHVLKSHGTFKQRVIIGAPNGIDYSFDLKHVVSSPSMNTSEASEFKRKFINFLNLSGIAAACLIMLLTSASALTATYISLIATVALSTALYCLSTTYTLKLLTFARTAITLGSIIYGVAAVCLINMLTPVSTLTTTYLTLGSAMTLAALNYLIWREPKAKVLDPLLPEQPEKPILKVNYNSIKTIPNQTPTACSEYNTDTLYKYNIMNPKQSADKPVVIECHTYNFKKKCL